jgi:glycosyltransferase involved in cell wall biosynthesis
MMTFDFSICTPVFNRADLLPRLYKSLCENMSCDVSFEWLLIDDGSTDAIEKFVQQVKADNIVSLRYIKKNNQGKHSCLNVAFEQAKGELLLILDSDDLLAPNALKTVAELWSGTAQKNKFAGIIGLCNALSTNEVSGDKFPSSPYYSTLVANAYKLNMLGDRCDFIRTDLLREKKFPIINGEKFMSEAVVMLDFDIDYKYICINECLKIIEYQVGGISNNFAKLSMKNPEGMVLRFERMLNERALMVQVSFKSKLKMYGNYIRYLLHSKKPFIANVYRIKKYFPLAFSIGFVAGVCLMIKDKITIKG